MFIQITNENFSLFIFHYQHSTIFQPMQKLLLTWTVANFVEIKDVVGRSTDTWSLYQHTFRVFKLIQNDQQKLETLNLHQHASDVAFEFFLLVLLLFHLSRHITLEFLDALSVHSFNKKKFSLLLSSFSHISSSRVFDENFQSNMLLMILICLITIGVSFKVLIPELLITDTICSQFLRFHVIHQRLEIISASKSTNSTMGRAKMVKLKFKLFWLFISWLNFVTFLQKFNLLNRQCPLWSGCRVISQTGA